MLLSNHTLSYTCIYTHTYTDMRVSPCSSVSLPCFAANRRRRGKKGFSKISAAEIFSPGKMGKARGLNSGGGESSLGYLFGFGESVSKPNKPNANTSFTTTTTTTTTTDGAGGRPTTTTTTHTTGDKNMSEEEKKKQISAGVRGSPNNYFRTEGQNCGNFLTDRPSTKVHAAPGGGSSLDYLFGSGPSGSGK